MNLIQSFSLIVIIIIFFPFIQHHRFIEAKDYDTCKKPFLCGNVSLSYPFYDAQNRPESCGYPGFKLNCSVNNQNPEISLTTSSWEKFNFLKMNQTSLTISVSRDDVWNGRYYCPSKLFNNSLNYTLFRYTPTVEIVTLYYDCPIGKSGLGNPFPCKDSVGGYYVISDIYNIPPSLCRGNIFFPVHTASKVVSEMQQAFQDSFELELVAQNGLCDGCRTSGGVCGYNTTKREFTCYCSDDQPHDFRCKYFW